jgi:beta-alanine degradation protein BauB
MTLDPAETNPQHYTVVFENDRVRVLEYTDQPGDRTTPHEHPDSVMHTLSAFRRRLHSGEDHRDVDMPAGLTGWLPAQQHSGENIGDTPTHVLFVELKELAGDSGTTYLGPDRPGIIARVTSPDGFPRGIGRPATGALLAAGYTELTQLDGMAEKDLLRMHGVGPKAVAVLREALAERGLSLC